MDVDQRAAIIRDLDKHAKDAASMVAFMSMRFRQLMESDETTMPPRDAVEADNALMDAMRALPELRRIFAKRARLLGGPPPKLALRPTDTPGRYRVVAVTPDGDLKVGEAVVTGTGRETSWRIGRTDLDGRAQGSIVGSYEIDADGLLEAVNRHLDEHGPWWSATEEDGPR